MYLVAKVSKNIMIEFNQDYEVPETFNTITIRYWKNQTDGFWKLIKNNIIFFYKM